jgi:hypothetical protein
MNVIYQIKNLINSKLYVGQSIDLDVRLRAHKSAITNKQNPCYNYPLYRAIRKYGWDNFEVSILEEVLADDDLTRREIYWYEKLNPEYNQVEPSKTFTKKNKPMYMIDPKTLKIVKEFKGFRDAQRYFGTSASSVSDAANGKRRMARNHYWVFVKDYTPDWKPPRKTNYNIIATNVTTGETKTYQTATDAAEGTGSDSRRIGDVVLGNKKTTNGWTFTKEQL